MLLEPNQRHRNQRTANRLPNVDVELDEVEQGILEDAALEPGQMR